MEKLFGTAPPSFGIKSATLISRMDADQFPQNAALATTANFPAAINIGLATVHRRLIAPSEAQLWRTMMQSEPIEHRLFLMAKRACLSFDNVETECSLAITKTLPVQWNR
jgi:hypothetical protein